MVEGSREALTINEAAEGGAQAGAGIAVENQAGKPAGTADQFKPLDEKDIAGLGSRLGGQILPVGISELPRKDDLISSAEKYWAKESQDCGCAITADGKPPDRTAEKTRFMESIKSLSPDDLKEIGGFLKQMADLEKMPLKGGYHIDDSRNVVNKIGKTLRDKYGNDPQHQEALLNGLSMALQGSDPTSTKWTVDGVSRDRVGSDPTRNALIVYEGLVTSTKLSPDTHTAEKVYADNKKDIEAGIKDFLTQYDISIFVRGGNYDEHKQDFKQVLEKLLPVLDKTFTEMVKIDGNDGERKSLMEMINAPLRAHAKSEGRSGEIPVISFHYAEPGYSSSISFGLLKRDGHYNYMTVR